jgi:hypothetical protein
LSRFIKQLDREFGIVSLRVTCELHQ